METRQSASLDRRLVGVDDVKDTTPLRALSGARLLTVPDNKAMQAVCLTVPHRRPRAILALTRRSSVHPRAEGLIGRSQQVEKDRSPGFIVSLSKTALLENLRVAAQGRPDLAAPDETPQGECSIGLTIAYRNRSPHSRIRSWRENDILLAELDRASVLGVEQIEPRGWLSQGPDRKGQGYHSGAAQVSKSRSFHAGQLTTFRSHLGRDL